MAFLRPNLRKNASKIVLESHYKIEFFAKTQFFENLLSFFEIFSVFAEKRPQFFKIRLSILKKMSKKKPDQT